MLALLVRLKLVLRDYGQTGNAVRDSRRRANRPHLGHGVRDGQPMLLAQILDRRGVLDELVGPPDADDRRLDLLLAEYFQHTAAVATGQDMILHRDDQIRRPTEELRRALIQRLGK